MKNLLLVDGSGYIFRAFYALPPITRPDGTPTGAVFGFTKMLMRLIKESRADYMAIIFDAARKNFRNDIYPDYKGTRKETPPELIPQFPLIRQAVAAFNVKSVEEEGFEADDLIAAYTKEAVAMGINVKVVSADKDMMQLLLKGVTLIDPMKNKEITEKEVMEKFGVKPEKLLDTMALIGDASDNVPGVSGIGPKTAAELINTYGSLENLFANTDKIKQEKRRQTLIAEQGNAFLSRRLITLAEDAPLPVPIASLAVQIPDCDKIMDFVVQNNFKSIIPSVQTWCEERMEKIPVRSVRQNYTLIQSKKALEDLLAEIKSAKVFAFDTVTSEQNPFKADLIGISVCTKSGEARYIPLNHTTESVQEDLFKTEQTAARLLGGQLPEKDVLSALADLWADNTILKVGHNIKFAMHVLTKACTYHNIDFSLNNFDDTMVMSYCLYGSLHGHGLDELAGIYLDYNATKFPEVAGIRSKPTIAQVPPKDVLMYAAEDSDMMMRLYRIFRKSLIEEGVIKVYEDMDKDLISVLFDMEQAGIKTDRQELSSLGEFFLDKLETLGKKIYAEAEGEFNINSPQQLGKILFEEMGLKGGTKTPTGAWRVDSDVLEKLAIGNNNNLPCQLAELVLDYRHYSKLKVTYTDALLAETDKQTGRVHTTFLQTSTSTGRLSSVNPNLQNIPIRSEEGKLIRKAFIADDGKVLISADYSQVELRLMAEIANVPHLKQAFLNNDDIHALTASKVFGVPMENMTADLRRKAKAVNFGIIYGISAFGLAKQLGVSRTEAAKYIEEYFNKYPEIKEYMEKTIQFATRNGFVTTITGRKCYIYGINDANAAKRGFAQRAAINAPIQGSAADIIKKAMINIAKELKAKNLAAKMLLQVHDELVFEADKDCADTVMAMVKRAMENVVKLSVPLPAEAGKGTNWASAH